MAFNSTGTESAKELIAEINALSDHLNDWEEGFMASIEQRVKALIPLTGPQMHKLEQIYEDVTERQFRDERMEREL